MISVSGVLLTELWSSFMDNNFIMINASSMKILQYMEDIYRQILGKFHYISFQVVLSIDFLIFLIFHLNEKNTPKKVSLNQKMALNLLKPHIMRYHIIENFVFFHMTPTSCQDDFLFGCYALFCETMVFSYSVTMETAL